MTAPTPHSAAKLKQIFDSLDYAKLAAIYCDDGGAEFWRVHREPALRQGIRWARALVRRLNPGRSLYVGAGVAELPPIVTEVLELEREVQICNLNGEECDVLNSCLEAVGVKGVEFECEDAMDVALDPGFDHLSVVSVFTDPENYPTVSGVGYGRISPVLLDLEQFEQERDRLRRLARHVVGALGVPAWVTTTVEEVPWILDAAQHHELHAEADDEMIDTAIVGDPIGFLRLT